MTPHAIDHPGRTDLRLRARERLTGRADPAGAPVTASAALAVLHQLASSPATAADALALLHELQVHQVELDLQAEELRGTRGELEADLQRQRQLYDGAPAGLFTVDANGAIHELNLNGASLLGFAREALLGRPLGSYLAAQSARELLAMLERVAGGSHSEAGALELADGPCAAHVVQANINADPAGGRFLVALLDLRSFR
jgi:PAS domain-containing protein